MLYARTEECGESSHDGLLRERKARGRSSLRERGVHIGSGRRPGTGGAAGFAQPAMRGSTPLRAMRCTPCCTPRASCAVLIPITFRRQDCGRRESRGLPHPSRTHVRRVDPRRVRQRIMSSSRPGGRERPQVQIVASRTGLTRTALRKPLSVAFRRLLRRARPAGLHAATSDVVFLVRASWRAGFTWRLIIDAYVPLSIFQSGIACTASDTLSVVISPNAANPPVSHDGRRTSIAHSATRRLCAASIRGSAGRCRRRSRCCFRRIVENARRSGRGAQRSLMFSLT